MFDIEAVFVSPTNVVLTWKNDPAASEYMCTVKNQMEMDRMVTVRDQKVCNITGLSPATSYTFSIIPGTGNGTWGDPTVKNVTTGKMKASRDGHEPFLSTYPRTLSIQVAS